MPRLSIFALKLFDIIYMDQKPKVQRTIATFLDAMQLLQDADLINISDFREYVRRIDAGSNASEAAGESQPPPPASTAFNCSCCRALDAGPSAVGGVRAHRRLRPPGERRSHGNGVAREQNAAQRPPQRNGGR